MNEAEKMPEREDYEIYAGIWDSPKYMKDLESFCTQQAEKIKELEGEKREPAEILERVNNYMDYVHNEYHDWSGEELGNDIDKFLSTQEKGNTL